MLNKTTLVLVGLVANSITFAGSMGPVCTPGSVTVPCEARQWSFGVDALYLKAINSAPMALRTNSLGGLSELNNEWNWGVRATGAYEYSTGKDVSVSWLHYSNTEPMYNLVGAFVVPSVPPAVVALPYTLSTQNHFDQVNAVTGQQIGAGVIDKVRFYAGLQYAAIQQDMTNYFAPGTYFDNNGYKGVGPIAGIDYNYELSPQVSLIANGSTSLLYGTTRMSTGYVVTPAVFAANYVSKKSVVPGFEAKLGLNYVYETPQGSLNLQGGYQVVDYFNVLQTRAAQALTNPKVSVDYALYGPYVGLKYLGNV